MKKYAFVTFFLQKNHFWLKMCPYSFSAIAFFNFLKFFAKNIHQQRALLIFLYLNFHNMFQPKTGSSSGELIN